MTFLVLLLAVAVAQVYGPMPSVQRDDWFQGWWRWLDTRTWLQAIPTGNLVVAILGPVLAVTLLLALTKGWLFGLLGIVINLTVLFYAFGREDVNALAQAYRDDLSREDVQAAWHDAADFDPQHGDSPAETWPQLHELTLARVSYRYFERYFPVIFWFVVFGASGALLYRLASLAVENCRSDNVESGADSHLLWVLEWIPLRLLGLVFALVGNFAATIHHWREIVFCTTSATAENLRRLTKGALEMGSQVSLREGAQEMDAVEALYSRALILSLGVVALVTILT